MLKIKALGKNHEASWFKYKGHIKLHNHTTYKMLEEKSSQESC